MKKIVMVVLAAMILIPAIAGAASIEQSLLGTYVLKGYNPGVSTSGPPSYTGELEMAESKGAYLMTWKIGPGGREIMKGVGVFDNGILSVAFKSGSAAGGVVSYKLEGNTLRGTWATYAGGPLGYEIMQK
jgi:hypothetical protein